MTHTRDYLLIAAGLAVLMILAAPWAEARTYADRTLSWECPTTRVDGAPFACATDAAGYDLEVTGPAANGVTPPSSIVELPPDATTRVINTDPPGTRYRLLIRDKAGTPSAWSPTVKSPAAPKRINTLSVQ